MVFLPADPTRRQQAREFCDAEAARLGLASLGWREVPVDASVLGPTARQTAPAIEQWLIGPAAAGAAPQGDALEALLFRLRRRVGDRAREAWAPAPSISISRP
jgi:glutamate synthase (ferredoxin)